MPFGLSYAERASMVYSKMVMGTLSIIASSLIIYKIFLRYRAQRNGSTVIKVTAYHRLMLGISLLDVFHSIWHAASTLPVPPSSGAILAHGTVRTCAIQGFWAEFSVMAPLYCASLSTYFLLKVRYNVADVVFSRIYEKWLHAVPIVCGLVLGTAGLFLKMFNPISTLPEYGCYIFPNLRMHPYVIQHYDAFLWGFAGVWLFLSFLIVLVNNILIFHAIRTQEHRNKKYGVAALGKQTSRVPRAATAAIAIETTEVSIQERCEFPDCASLREIPLSSNKLSSTSSKYPPQSTAQVELAMLTSPRSGILSPGEDVENEAEKENVDEDGETSRFDGGILSLRKCCGLLFCELNCLRDPAAHRRKKITASRTAAVQGLLYVTVSLLVAVWHFLPWFVWKLGLGNKWRFAIGIMFSTFYP